MHLEVEGHELNRKGVHKREGRIPRPDLCHKSPNFITQKWRFFLGLCMTNLVCITRSCLDADPLLGWGGPPTQILHQILPPSSAPFEGPLPIARTLPALQQPIFLYTYTPTQTYRHSYTHTHTATAIPAILAITAIPAITRVQQ